MPKYRLANRPLLWPNSCAECGASATARANSTCSVVTKVGYFVIFARTTHLTATVSYPVCERHVYTARFAGALSARNLFNLFLGVLWAISAFKAFAALYRTVFEKDWSALVPLAWFGGAFAIGLTVISLARRFTPVKLNGADEQTITVSIRNESYAAEFIRLNAQQTVALVPWWKS